MFTPAPEILISIFMVGSLFLWGLQERASRVVAFGLTAPITTLTVWSLSVLYPQISGYIRLGVFVLIQLLILGMLLKGKLLARSLSAWWASGLVAITATGFTIALISTYQVWEGIFQLSSLGSLLFFGEIRVLIWTAVFLLSASTIKHA
ncbi:MAG: hypothetical protein AAB343_00185 [Patescibacteria group bacterium]